MSEKNAKRPELKTALQVIWADARVRWVLILMLALLFCAVVLVGGENFFRNASAERAEKEQFAAMQRLLPAATYEPLEDFDASTGLTEVRRAVDVNGFFVGHICTVEVTAMGRRLTVVVGVDEDACVTGAAVTESREIGAIRPPVTSGLDMEDIFTDLIGQHLPVRLAAEPGTEDIVAAVEMAVNAALAAVETE